MIHSAFNLNISLELNIEIPFTYLTRALRLPQMSQTIVNPIQTACTPSTNAPTIVNVGTPNCTLYIQNLNEKASIPTLKYDLLRKFSAFGQILEFNAKKSLKMRGQAFVVFSTEASAKKALQELQGRPLYGKPMVIRYAKYKSDVHSKADGTWQEERAKRLQEQKLKAEGSSTSRKQVLQQLANAAALKGIVPSVPAVVASAAPYLDLMNKTLFVQSIPSGTTREELEKTFGEGFCGFIEVRTVPGRPDLAFVDYETDQLANAAKICIESRNASSGCTMRISFAKK